MYPIIFIPGIEATTLVDSNTFDFSIRWNAYDTIFTSLGTKITGPYIEEKLQINPLYDENVQSIIERNHIARMPYEKSIRNLATRFPNDPIFLFGYDWRLSNVENGKRLNLFVNYLQNKLQNEDIKGFRFVTHSMGALVFSCYLSELKGDYSLIDRVVFAAPPFKGSPYSIIHMIKGDGGLKSFLNKLFGRDEDIRKVIRTYPALYELLPWYEKAVTYENNNHELDLTKKEQWQSNIWDDIEELFDARLSSLAEFRKNKLYDLSSLPIDLRERMLVIAGSEDKTITRLSVLEQKGQIKNFVRLDNMISESGDGTVPLVSSTIYKESIRTIIVEKENYFDELSNNIDFHGLFLRDSRVQNIIRRFFIENSGLKSNDGSRSTPFPNENSKWWESPGGKVTNLSPF